MNALLIALVLCLLVVSSVYAQECASGCGVSNAVKKEMLVERLL